MVEANTFPKTPEGREHFFIVLYQRVFPGVAKYVSSKGGSFDEAKDVFQDAIVIYYENLVAGKLSVNSDEKGYLFGISKHLWLKKFNAGSKLDPLDGIDLPSTAAADQPDGQRLMHYLETAGKKCMELLRSFYYDRFIPEEAAQRFGFSGVRSVTVQKYKCLEKVREYVRKKALRYEDFLA